MLITYLAIVAVIYTVMRVHEPGQPRRQLPHLRIWLWPWEALQVLVCWCVLVPLCGLLTMARR